MSNRVEPFEPSDFRRTATFRADGKSRFQDLAIVITEIIVEIVISCYQNLIVRLSAWTESRALPDFCQAFGQ